MSATVVVLTFNAGPWIDEVLAAILAQQTTFEWEVLVIDSGSGDSTLDAVKRCIETNQRRVRLVEIPNSEFGHGKTRNQAARLAEGDFIVFLTHDAVPSHEHWLEAMVQPFHISDRVACVFGKQVPRPDCCPTVKRDVTNVFRRFGSDYAISLHERNDLVTHPVERDAMTFFSDVNSAVRKSILLGPIPYRDLAYAEDQAFGRDVIDAGYLKAYTPLGAVIHSHSYSLLKYYRRMYDEMLGIRRATGRTLDTPLAYHLNWIGQATLEDWAFIVRDPAYSGPQKLKWLAESPFYNSARRLAIRLSANDGLPAWLSKFSSLDANRA